MNKGHIKYLKQFCEGMEKGLIRAGRNTRKMKVRKDVKE